MIFTLICSFMDVLGFIHLWANTSCAEYLHSVSHTIFFIRSSTSADLSFHSGPVKSSFPFYLLEYLFVGLTIERWISAENYIEYDTGGPDIAFLIVAAFEHFRCNVERLITGAYCPCSGLHVVLRNSLRYLSNGARLARLHLVRYPLFLNQEYL